MIDRETYLSEHQKGLWHKWMRNNQVNTLLSIVSVGTNPSIDFVSNSVEVHL